MDLPSLGNALAAAFVMALGACGPSYQVIYEGDARFEHCYALDESADVAAARKQACWHEWSQRYVYGQTRDRVEYATARDKALSQTNVPTDEAMMAAAPGGKPSDRLLAVPAPTSAFAPPPVTYQNDGGVGAVGGGSSTGTEAKGGQVLAAPMTALLPANDCATDCAAGWKGCLDGAKEQALACDKEYRRCMRYCYREPPAKRGGH